MIPVQYLAGFVDGEGYLGLARIRRHHRSRDYCLRLSIYNTNRMILQDIQRASHETKSATRQPYIVWKVTYALIQTNADAMQLILNHEQSTGDKYEKDKTLLTF